MSRYLKAHHSMVAAFYTSNVEGYLSGDSAQGRPLYQTSIVTNSMLEWVDVLKSHDIR